MTANWRFRALCILLAASAALPRAADAQQVSQSGDISALNPLSQFDPLSLKDFRQRPLFSVTRRAPETAAEQSAADAPSESVGLDIRLLGIVIGPEGRLARIADESDKSTHALRIGEIYRDWKILAITASSLTLAKDGETKTLTIFASPDDVLQRDAIDTAASPLTAPLVEDVAAPAKSIPPATLKKPSSAGDAHAQDLLDFFGNSTSD